MLTWFYDFYIVILVYHVFLIYSPVVLRFSNSHWNGMIGHNVKGRVESS